MCCLRIDLLRFVAASLPFDTIKIFATVRHHRLSILLSVLANWISVSAWRSDRHSGFVVQVYLMEGSTVS